MANEAENPTTQTTATAPVNSGQKNSGQSGQGDSDGIRERLKRAERKTLEKALSELGTKDLETAKALIAEAKALKEGQLTENQRTQAAKDKAETELNSLKVKYQEAIDSRTRDRVDSAIKEATGLKEPKQRQQMLTLIRTEYADDVTALVDDKGDVSDKSVADLVAKFRKDNPSYFTSGGVGSPSNAGGRMPDANQAAKDAQKKASTTNRRMIRG